MVNYLDSRSTCYSIQCMGIFRCDTWRCNMCDLFWRQWLVPISLRLCLDNKLIHMCVWRLASEPIQDGTETNNWWIFWTQVKWDGWELLIAFELLILNLWLWPFVRVTRCPDICQNTFKLVLKTNITHIPKQSKINKNVNSHPRKTIQRYHIGLFHW